MKAINKYWKLFILVTMFISATAYAFTTFATISYVDKKQVEVKDTIKDIKLDVREIRNYLIPVPLRLKT